MRSIMVHSVLPQRLSHLCRRSGTRLIQISSDGVFSGMRGGYSEDDAPDASDLYGISKLLGEVADPHAITLRTSIIGHELQSRGGLLEWFLSQQGQCRCYTRAIFSGFPTIVLAESHQGYRHPAPGPVWRLSRGLPSDLEVRSVAAGGGALRQENRTNTGRSPSPDRTLVAARFEKATGYVAPDWPTLVDLMYCDRFGSTRT